MSAPTPAVVTFRSGVITLLAGITVANGYNFTPAVEAIETLGLDWRVEPGTPRLIVGTTRIVEIEPGHTNASRGVGEVEVLVRVVKIADAAGALADALKAADDVMRCVQAAPARIAGNVQPPYCSSMEVVPELEDARDTIDVLVVIRALLNPLF